MGSRRTGLGSNDRPGSSSVRVRRSKGVVKCTLARWEPTRTGCCSWQVRSSNTTCAIGHGTVRDDRRCQLLWLQRNYRACGYATRAASSTKLGIAWKRHAIYWEAGTNTAPSNAVYVVCWVDWHHSRSTPNSGLRLLLMRGQTSRECDFEERLILLSSHLLVGPFHRQQMSWLLSAKRTPRLISPSRSPSLWHISNRQPSV